MGSKHTAGCEQCCSETYSCDGCCQEGIQKPEYLRPQYAGLEFEPYPFIDSWDPSCCCLTQAWRVVGTGKVGSCCKNLYTGTNSSTIRRIDRLLVGASQAERGYGNECCGVFSDLVCGVKCCIEDNPILAEWEESQGFYGRADFAVDFYIEIAQTTWSVRSFVCDGVPTCKVVMTLHLSGRADFRINELKLSQKSISNLSIDGCHSVIPYPDPGTMILPSTGSLTPTSEQLASQCDTVRTGSGGTGLEDFCRCVNELGGVETDADCQRINYQLPICFKGINTWTIEEWEDLPSATIYFDDTSSLPEGCEDSTCNGPYSCGLNDYFWSIAIDPPEYLLPTDCTDGQTVETFYYDVRDASKYLCPTEYGDICGFVLEDGRCDIIRGIEKDPCPGAPYTCPPYPIDYTVSTFIRCVDEYDEKCRLSNFTCRIGGQSVCDGGVGAGTRQKTQAESGGCYTYNCYCIPEDCCGGFSFLYYDNAIVDAYRDSCTLTENTTTCTPNEGTTQCTYSPGLVLVDVEYPADRTPDPINWTSITYDCPANTCQVTSEQVTGITGPITLSITGLVSGLPNSGPPDLYYKISSTQQTGPLTGPPDGTWTKITTNPFTTPLIYNNQWVSFTVYDTTNSDASRLIDIVGGTPSAPLDTFTISSTSCPDYTPNPTLNWNNLWHDVGSDESNIVSQRFLGINRSLSIKLDIGAGTQPVLYYRVTSTSLVGALPIGPPDGSWAAVTSDTTITVNLNDWLNFRCYNADLTVSSRTFDVVNVSDANTVLDTITYESY